MSSGGASNASRGTIGSSDSISKPTSTKCGIQTPSSSSNPPPRSETVRPIPTTPRWSRPVRTRNTRSSTSTFVEPQRHRMYAMPSRSRSSILARETSRGARCGFQLSLIAIGRTEGGVLPNAQAQLRGLIARRVVAAHHSALGDCKPVLYGSRASDPGQGHSPALRLTKAGNTGIVTAKTDGDGLPRVPAQIGRRTRN